MSIYLTSLSAALLKSTPTDLCLVSGSSLRGHSKSSGVSPTDPNSAPPSSCKPPLPFLSSPNLISSLRKRRITLTSADSCSMLLGMYYNGYMLFAISLGQTAGYIAFGRDTCSASIDHTTVGHCC